MEEEDEGQEDESQEDEGQKRKKTRTEEPVAAPAEAAAGSSL